MFSLSEFFLIIFVALVVLGPSVLQALLFQLGNFLKKSNNLIIQLIEQRPALQEEQILAENNKRVRKVNGRYKEK
jgi:Sec-independent protein translocase protein TatA